MPIIKREDLMGSYKIDIASTTETLFQRRTETLLVGVLEVDSSGAKLTYEIWRGESKVYTTDQFMDAVKKYNEIT